jgi:hypothetical protein
MQQEMKKILLILGLFFCTSALSQDWLSGTKYITSSGSDGFVADTLNVTGESGDTIYIQTSSAGSANPRRFMYFLDKLYNEEKKLTFDFGLEEGDTLIYVHGLGDTILVDSVREVELHDGNRYTHFYVYNMLDHQHHTLIKGVGGLMYGLEPLNTITIPEYHAIAAICRNDEVIHWEIYQNGIKTNTTCDFESYTRKNSVESIENSPFSIYPNPTSTKLTIVNAPQNTRYVIYSLQGQKIDTEVKDGVVNVCELPQGIYILEILAADKMYRTRFIKE